MNIILFAMNKRNFAMKKCILQMVLRAGADPNFPVCPVSSLQFAVTCCCFDEDFLKILLNYGAVWDITEDTSADTVGSFQEKFQCLIDAGEKNIVQHLMHLLPDDDKDMNSRMQYSLKRMCRTVIRASMAPFHVRKLQQLHLPESLANFILLNEGHTLDYSEDLK